MAIDQIIYGYVANEERYPEGATIIEEGAKGEWVYVILEGQVKVKKRSLKGMVTLQTLKEGEFFGEMALLEPPGTSYRTSSVIADSPVRVGVMDIERLIRDYEKISLRMKGLIRAMTTRLKKTTERAVEMVAELM
jgi:CRP-like cAMP-binding protein